MKQGARDSETPLETTKSNEKKKHAQFVFDTSEREKANKVDPMSMTL